MGKLLLVEEVVAGALTLMLGQRSRLQRGVEELEQPWHRCPEDREDLVGHLQIKYGAYSSWHLDC